MARVWAGNALREEEARDVLPVGPVGRPRDARQADPVWKSRVRVAFRPSMPSDGCVQRQAVKLFGRGRDPDTPGQTHVELVVDYVCPGADCPLQGLTRCARRYDANGRDADAETKHHVGVLHRCSVMAVDAPAYAQQVYVDRRYKLEGEEWVFVEIEVEPDRFTELIEAIVLIATDSNLTSNREMAIAAKEWVSTKLGSDPSVAGQWTDAAAREIVRTLGFLADDDLDTDDLNDSEYRLATSSYLSVYHFAMHMRHYASRSLCCGLLEAPSPTRTRTCACLNLPRSASPVTRVWASLVDCAAGLCKGLGDACTLLGTCATYCAGAPNTGKYSERGFFLNTTGVSCACSPSRARDRLLQCPLCCCVATHRACYCVAPAYARYELLHPESGAPDGARVDELLRPMQCAELTTALLVSVGFLEAHGDYAAVTPTRVYELVWPRKLATNRLLASGRWQRTTEHV
jgi:hypothetical protein